MVLWDNLVFAMWVFRFFQPFCLFSISLFHEVMLEKFSCLWSLYTSRLKGQTFGLIGSFISSKYLNFRLAFWPMCDLIDALLFGRVVVSIHIQEYDNYEFSYFPFDLCFNSSIQAMIFQWNIITQCFLSINFVCNFMSFHAFSTNKLRCKWKIFSQTDPRDWVDHLKIWWYFSLNFWKLHCASHAITL